MTFLGLVHNSAVAIIIFLAALGLGNWVLRLLRIDVHGFRLLWLATTCGLGLLSVGTMILGMVGGLDSVLFALLLTPLVITGILLLTPQVDWHNQVRFWLCLGMNDWLFRICAYLLLLLSASTALWILLTHALMPPNEWDEIAYHMALPKLYVGAHRIIYVPFIVQSNWPMNSQMLFTGSLLWGAEIAPHLVMLGTAVLSALGILVVTRRHFDDRVGIVGVALFLTVPLVGRLAGTGLIDVSLGLYVLAALVALNCCEHEQRRSWLVLCGAYSGFAAGSKLTGIAFPILLGLLLLMDELRQSPLRLSVVLQHSALFSLGVLFVAGPWYVRSILFTGNPIWPFAYSIFGGRNWDPLGDTYLQSAFEKIVMVKLPITISGLFQSLAYLLLHPAEMGGYSGGLGFSTPLGTLCAVGLVLHAPRLLWQNLFVSAGFYLLWFAFTSHELRYLLPIIPLLALAAAYFFVWLYATVRLRPLQLVLLIGLLVIIFQGWPWGNTGGRELLASRMLYLRGEMSRDAWLDTQYDDMSLFRYANTHLPADARILLLPYENRGYYLDRDYVWGHLASQRIIPFERFTNPAELAAALRRMGITHVIDNPIWILDGIPYWDHDRTLMQKLQAECGQALFRQGQAVLYQLTDCTSPSSAGKP